MCVFVYWYCWCFVLCVFESVCVLSCWGIFGLCFSLGCLGVSVGFEGVGRFCLFWFLFGFCLFCCSGNSLGVLGWLVWFWVVRLLWVLRGIGGCLWWVWWWWWFCG